MESKLARNVAFRRPLILVSVVHRVSVALANKCVKNKKINPQSIYKKLALNYFVVKILKSLFFFFGSLIELALIVCDDKQVTSGGVAAGEGE